KSGRIQSVKVKTAEGDLWLGYVDPTYSFSSVCIELYPNGMLKFVEHLYGKVLFMGQSITIEGREGTEFYISGAIKNFTTRDYLHLYQRGKSIKVSGQVIASEQGRPITFIFNKNQIISLNGLKIKISSGKLVELWPHGEFKSFEVAEPSQLLNHRGEKVSVPAGKKVFVDELGYIL
ncbi:MAG: hypothetical protein KDD40_06100, partial [Bdellovibrionales bacterium]|nr:hypothetical protein [Bdellovibrionales bacterium]